MSSAAERSSVTDSVCLHAGARDKSLPVRSLSDPTVVQPGVPVQVKRVPWTHDPRRQVCCDHRHLTITETPTSVIGPDPLYDLTCTCGWRVLQVGAPSQTEHATPTSQMGRFIRARFARKGSGYM